MGSRGSKSWPRLREPSALWPQGPPTGGEPMGAGNCSCPEGFHGKTPAGAAGALPQQVFDLGKVVLKSQGQLACEAAFPYPGKA